METFELNERENDLLDVEDYYGNQSFEWNGDIYQCTPNPISDTSNLELGGIGGDTVMQFTVRLSQFANNVCPIKGDNITFNGFDYEINKIEKDTAGICYAVDLILPSP